MLSPLRFCIHVLENAWTLSSLTEKTNFLTEIEHNFKQVLVYIKMAKPFSLQLVFKPLKEISTRQVNLGLSAIKATYRIVYSILLDPAMKNISFSVICMSQCNIWGCAQQRNSELQDFVHFEHFPLLSYWSLVCNIRELTWSSHPLLNIKQYLCRSMKQRKRLLFWKDKN